MPLEAASEHPPKQSGELKPYGLARLLRTAGKWYQSWVSPYGFTFFGLMLIGED
jgi:hypothetical protein